MKTGRMLRTGGRLLPLSILVSSLWLSSFIAWAQPPSRSNVLPETPKGLVVAAWFEAFNSGDAASMNQFEVEHFSEELLSRFDGNARKEMYLQM